MVGVLFFRALVDLLVVRSTRQVSVPFAGHFAKPGKTATVVRLYTASAMHWSAAERDSHEQMGFHQGWGESFDRRARLAASQARLIVQTEQLEQSEWEGEELEDDRLRLIFICCHPALSGDVQVPLTLREVCDLTTEEVARAFLSTPSSIAQRIVRAKAKIRDAQIPYQVPSLSELPERLESVLRVIYLVFNEGYSASQGVSAIRDELTGEAIRLARLSLELLPDPEVMGLLGLMRLHESRRQARISVTGELVLLDAQDRALWNTELLAEGCSWVERALAGSVPTGYRRRSRRYMPVGRGRFMNGRCN